MSHTHITSSDQYQIASLLRKGYAQNEVARIIDKTPSAVCQEIKRNKDCDGIYRTGSAQRKKNSRRTIANQRFRRIENDQKLEKHVEKELRRHRSPEQIAGRLKRIHGKSCCKDTIYVWIYTKRKDLVKYLHCKKGFYRRRYGTRIREKQREEAKIKRIDTRPAIVDKRERIGDWEGDTIIGSDKKKRLVTVVERRSGYGIIEKIDDVSALHMHTLLQKSFCRISKDKRHTFTYDNGTEIGKEDADLEKKIHMDVYRAYPYHSWERGCNENFNGLVRTFFPKKTNFGTISIQHVKYVQYLLNHRPRKRLGYLTPHEVFYGITPAKLFD